MGSFGDRLQREREMRGISLEEIAEATKIGTRSLRALEEEDFDKLPGGIFNKGFVRAYARYLGLDEEQAVADYQAAMSEAIAAGRLIRQESAAGSATPERAPDLSERAPIRLPVGPILVVVMLVAVLLGGWKYYAKYGVPKLRHVRAAGQQPAAPKTDPARSRANAPQAAPEPPHSESNKVQLAAESPRSGANAVQPQHGFVVRLKAKQNSWVSIVADGQPVMSGELPVNTEKSIHAQQSVVLKIGNAAGIELYHNDKLVPPVGGEGQVKTVEFTAAGLR